MIAATIEAKRIPIFASSSSIALSNANPLMNIETVKPIPAIEAIPAICRLVVPGGRVHSPIFTAKSVNNVIPTIYPTTNPTTMPCVIPDETASPIASVLNTTPAFAKAKRGRIMNPVNG